MARFCGIFLNAFLLVLLAVQPGTSQSTGTDAPKKADATGTPASENGKTKSTSKTDANATKKATNKKENAAQTAAKPAPLTPETTHRIVTEIRSRYSVPSQVSISVGDPKPGNMSGYDDVVVTFTGGTNTTHHDFLISTDRKTLAHVEKIDISQDLMSKIDVKGRPVKGIPTPRSPSLTSMIFSVRSAPACTRLFLKMCSRITPTKSR